TRDDTAHTYIDTLSLHDALPISNANGTYNGNANANDGTATMVLFTRAAATFANSPIPAGQVNFKAVVSRYNSTKQLQLRNLNDRSEEHTSELQSRENLVCRLLLE